MDRTATLMYLQSEYAQIASDSRMDDTQTADAYGKAADMALRQLGYEETDLSTTDVPQAQIIPYLALLRYYVLRRFGDVLAVRVDTNANGVLSLARSQAYKSIGELASKAAAECAGLGYPVDGAGQAQVMTVGRFNLDFLEPSCEAGGEW